MRPHTDLDPINDKEQVLPIAKVLQSAPVLEGIVKHIILLYIHVMDTADSVVSIHATSHFIRTPFRPRRWKNCSTVLHRYLYSTLEQEIY